MRSLNYDDSRADRRLHRCRQAAPETPLDAMWLAEMLEEIDLPEGVVSIVPGGRETGESLVRHPGVDKISFTGSSATRRTSRPCR